MALDNNRISTQDMAEDHRLFNEATRMIPSILSHRLIL